MGVRTLCCRWVNYCMGYGRLASFMWGFDIVGECRGARAVGTRLLCKDADRGSRCVRWTLGLWEKGTLVVK